MTALATIARGGESRVTERRLVIVRSLEEWTALWAAHAGPSSEAPRVDFARSLVAGAFAGSQPSGSSIEIVGAVEEEGGARLVVEERTVEGSDPTAPFHIVSLPRVEGEIRWTDATRKRPAPADSGARIARGAHSRKTATGLRPRTAAMLSYLAGPASGLIMLVAEPAQPFVRFHAWQSIIALGALGAAVGVCYALAFVSLFFSANGLAVMVRLATVVWFVLVALWAGLIWQAWTGRVWKLPLAGEWAEVLANKIPRSAASGQFPA